MPRNYETQSEQEFSTNRGGLPVGKLILVAVVLIAILIVGIWAFKVKTVKGNELGIEENWSEGVVNKVYQPGTYFLWPGWSRDLITYDASSQIFVMNNKSEKSGEKGHGRDADAYRVQSQEGQDMTISLNLRWRLNATNLVVVHKTVRHDIEEKLIRPVVMRVVKDEATKKKAIDAYSGQGLVDLQGTIQSHLTANIELQSSGVIVENFVIEHIELDPNYINEIKLKQIATQRTLRAVEEEKASTAEAQVAKAKAQADYEKNMVIAKQNKDQGVLEAQKKNEMTILDAEGQKKKLQLEAEGARLAAIEAAEAEKQKRELEAAGQLAADLNRAKGIEALGKSEAEATRLKLSAYAVAGSDNYTRIQVATQFAEGTKGITGYLPQGMSINLVAENYAKGVNLLMGSATGASTAPAAPKVSMDATDVPSIALK